MTSRTRRGSRAGVAALVLACVLWGTTGTAASFLPPEVPRVAVGAATMGIGGAVLFLITLRGALGVLRDRVARRWVLIGAVGVAVYPLAFYPAMQLAGVAIGNAVALGTGPVFAALLEWLLERRRPDLRWALGAAGAVIGVVLLAVGGDGAGAGTGDVLPGVLLGMVAGLAYATYAYASGRAMRADQAAAPVMGAMFGTAAAPLLVVLACTAGPLFASWSSTAIAGYLALGPTVLGYLCFGVGVRVLASSSVTVITLLEPVLTTVLAVLVVGERLQPLAWAGLGVVLAAVALVSLSAQREAAPGAGRIAGSDPAPRE